MNILPLDIEGNSLENSSSLMPELLKIEKNKAGQYIPAEIRRNALSDMDFNIIADTIRCQNLKKQMNIRLMSLKRNLNKCSQLDACSKI